jgi:hypothetical protein
MLQSRVRVQTLTVEVVIPAHIASRSATRVGARAVAAAARMHPVEDETWIGKG